MTVTVYKGRRKTVYKSADQIPSEKKEKPVKAEKPKSKPVVEPGNPV